MKERILELRKQGMTYNEIKKELGCSKGTISFHCRKNNLSNPNDFKKKISCNIEEMQSFYDKCKSCRETAKKFGVDRHTVTKYIKTEKRKLLNGSERKKKKSSSVISWRQRTKLKLIEYKGGECKECGYKKCVQALEFHHLDPKEKDFTISGKSWSFERLKEESDKCVLVCNRCHTEIHAGLNENYKL